MSSYTWYPGAMPLPAEQAASIHFPFHPRFGKTSNIGCRGGACRTKSGYTGVDVAYPRYSNGCERGSCGAPLVESCKRAAVEQAYYNPSGTAYDALPFGTSTGTCDPSFGCLDPRAQSFDKMAQVHCQSFCMYKKPRICSANSNALLFADEILDQSRTANICKRLQHAIDLGDE